MMKRIVASALLAGLCGLPVAAAAEQKAAQDTGNFMARPGFEASEPSLKNVWESHGSGYEVDRADKHSGNQSIRLMAIGKGEGAVAVGSLPVTRIKTPTTLIISGWSKAKDVTGSADGNYAIYVDVNFADGTNLYDPNMPFSTGTHDWEYRSLRIPLPKPVTRVSVFLLLREKHAGTAWFDDIYAAPYAEGMPRYEGSSLAYVVPREVEEAWGDCVFAADGCAATIPVMFERAMKNGTMIGMRMDFPPVQPCGLLPALGLRPQGCKQAANQCRSFKRQESKFLSFFCLCMLLTLVANAAGGPGETSVRIGKERQLFLDDFLIAQTSNVTRRVCPVTKWSGNPVIRREADWEPICYQLYGSVLYDEEEKLYKAWCNGRGGVYYFTSADGIRWEKPKLDLFPVAGQPTHQVVLAGTNQTVKGWRHFLEHFGVTKDQREPAPARRYKMGYLYLERNYRGPGASPFHSNERRGLGVAFSPDGIRWTPMDEPATYATRDGQTHWMFDEKTDRYVLYGRTKHIAPEVQVRYGSDPIFKYHWGRAVARAESKDFAHWEPDEGQFILSSDTKDGPMDEIYSLNVFPYEGLYIGLVQVFHNYPDRVWLDIQLAVSRDSAHFQRLSDRSPFIPVGGVGAWDRFNNSVANSRPIAAGDELRFYYSGRNVVHSSPFKQSDDGKRASVPYQGAIGFGTIKRDRFAAMEATFDPGMLRTKPFIFDGQRLHINAAVEFGSLTVALLDADGKPIERTIIQGQDAVDVAVPLSKLGSLSGKPARLEFTLSNGRLYSFWID